MSQLASNLITFSCEHKLLRGPTPTKHKGPLQYGLDEINGNTYRQRCSNCSIIEDFDSLISQVNQGLTVYGNKGSTDQHA